MKDFIAIVGAAVVITGSITFALLGGSSVDEGSADDASSAVLVNQVSVPVDDMPEVNSEPLRNKAAPTEGQIEDELGKSEKPVITIEEIDPQDQKQSIKAKLDQAKAQEGMRAQVRKQALERKAVLREQKELEKETKPASKKKTQKAKKADQFKAEQIKVDDPKKTDKSEMVIEKAEASDKSEMAESDSGDPGKIIFGSRLEPFSAPEKDEPKIPDPMELLDADSSILNNIVNSTQGPSPYELHGTWEILPCHSSVGVIATRSFEMIGLPSGTGAYYEIVQFYSDAEQKVFGPRTETTIYVKLDEQHMLAAVNANTNASKFSVLRKISSEIEKGKDEFGGFQDAAMEEESIKETVTEKKLAKKETAKKKPSAKEKDARKDAREDAREGDLNPKAKERPGKKPVKGSSAKKQEKTKKADPRKKLS